MELELKVVFLYEVNMRIFLTVFVVMFLFLSCEDGNKNISTDEDGIAVNDSSVDEELEDGDDNIAPDEGNVVERSPEGIAVSSGVGTIRSGSYKMELTVGKPFSGQLMTSNNYKLEIRIK